MLFIHQTIHSEELDKIAIRVTLLSQENETKNGQTLISVSENKHWWGKALYLKLTFGHTHAMIACSCWRLEKALNSLLFHFGNYFLF